jgi:hypothetical protein
LVVIVVVVLALFTTWFKMEDVLPVRFASPGNTAVIGCVAIASVDIASVATPEALVVPVPIEVPLSLKVMTSPTVGVGVTVAVNVTDCPSTEGLEEEATAVVELPMFTVCATPGEALPV